MIYITGDTHCPIDVSKLNTKQFPEQRSLTKNDYLVICGDVGLVWDNSNSDKWWKKWFEKKNFTTLFVDGNHENHDMLQEYPIEVWNGGKIHKIGPSIIHLMRGQVFMIEGMKFFTMGGASSNDMEYRTEGLNWWAGEFPSNEERKEAIESLDRAGWEVDYIITHTASDSIIKKLNVTNKCDELTCFFDEIDEKLKFKHWYFGHFHEDKEIGEKHTALYQTIIKL